MGSSSTKTYDREITRKIRETHNQNEAIHGLLLLGAGESGKSTFMRQMRHLWGQQYSEYDRLKYRNVLWENLIESMQILCRQHLKLETSKISNHNAEEEKNSEAIEYILQMSIKTVFDRNIKDLFQVVWEDPGIQSTFSHKDKYYIMDSAEYFFNNMNNYIGEDFIPSFIDLCHCRIRTLGITQEQFDYQNITFRIYDVGGQRNERRKWLHTFDNCKAILFVTSLIGYTQVTFEDESTNRMHESFAVYDKYLNHPAFEAMNIILFLNKNDLYKKMIRKYPFFMFPENNTENNTLLSSSSPLSTASAPALMVSEDKNTNNGSKRHGKYHSCNSSSISGFTTAITMAKISEYTGNRTSNTEVVEYIINIFKNLTSGLDQKQSKRLLFHHLTCATSTESVKAVFQDVRHIIMQSHLKEASLYS